MRDHRGKADRNDVASYAQTGQDDDSRARAGVGGAFRFVKASELCCTSLLPRKGSDGGSPLPTTVESGGGADHPANSRAKSRDYVNFQFPELDDEGLS